MRYLVMGLVVAIAAFLHAAYALAFSSQDAGTVVRILEQLAPERGESVYYDEEAADDWHEFDDEGDRLIPAAGLSRDAWRDVYGKTLKGLIALLPEAEIELLSVDLAEKVAAIPGLDDEQRREALASMQEAVDRLRALRAEGAEHADAVRPYAARLRDLADF